MEAVKPTSEQGQYLTFRVAGEEYAVGILRVREILEFGTITKVPNTPASIRGVLNVRGSVVPVVDLAVKFALPPSTVTKRTCVVVVEIALEQEKTVMGLMADSVNQVMDLLDSEIQPPPAFGTRVRIEYLQGMGQVGRGFVLLLDLDRLLSESELCASTTPTGEAEPGSEGRDNGPEVVPSGAGEPEAAASPEGPPAAQVAVDNATPAPGEGPAAGEEAR